jgi:predicted Zn-dependent protease
VRGYISVIASAVFTVAIFMVFRFVLQGGLAQGEGRPRDPIGVPPPAVASKVYFQPLSSFPVDDAVELAAHYKQKFGLAIEVLEPMPIPDQAFDRGRGQAVAERLIDQIKTADVLDRDPGSIVIGLTTVDMYIASLDWRYAFNLRSNEHLAVVSTAVMQERGADHELVMRRLQKMVTKNVGILYYGLHGNDDPGSVLYRNVGGNSELDRMSEDF